MQGNEAFQQAHSSVTDNEEDGLLAALLTTAPGLLSRYNNQLLAMGRTIRLELMLNLKCGILILCFAIVLGCVMLSSWIGLNALLYFGLAAIDAPLWTIVMAIGTAHVVALIGLYRAIKLVYAEMGFKQLLDILGHSADGKG